jgi:hypothetical protein
MAYFHPGISIFQSSAVEKKGKEGVVVTSPSEIWLLSL